MTPPRLERVEEIFHGALECAPDQLSAFLDKTCAGDKALRAKVEELLTAHQQAGGFIEIPLATLDTSIAENGQPGFLIGQTIGHYEILEEIGRGGMGVIYRARQRYSRRFVALKRVLTYHADSHETLARFRREAEAAASLDHPNILPIHEVGETEDGLPFFSMKLATGGSLRTVASTLRGKVRECVQLMAKAARAVEYAHGQGLLHRDLQPGNILLDARGEPMVSDFGLAKWLGEESDLTRTLTTFGTPGYIAPEQAEGATSSSAAYIYSLGAILFSLLAGRPPFVGANALSVIRQAAATPAPKLRSFAPSVGRDLETIVARCLERDPKARYQTAGALAEDLERWLEGRPIIARPVRAPARVWRWSRRNPVLAGGAVFCFLLIGAMVWLLREHFAASPPAPPEKSVAILPFQNLSKDQENAFFTDGIQEEILSRLSKIADLKVISRTSTQRYKSAPKNLLEIGRQLGVAHIVEGSVQKSGGAVRVNVQLIKAANDSHVWADKYDRKLTDIFAVESEIAAKVADALQAKLSGSEQRAITSRPTENLEAYQWYLKGRHLLAQLAETALLKAIDYFHQALSLDPNYARAYSGIADCYIVLPVFSKLSPRECYTKAKEAANQALKLDNELGEAHVSLAVLLMNEGKPVESQREFLRAIDLDPNYANAHYRYGMNYFVPLGRFDEGIAQIKRAIELDPLSAPVNANLGRAYSMARRYPEAIAQLRRTIELDQNFGYGHGWLGVALDLSGRHDEAVAEYQKAYELSHDFHVLYGLARAYAAGGEPDKARQLLDQLRELERQGSVWHYFFAFVYAALGDRDQALSRLEQSYRAGEAGSLLYIRVDPWLDPLRGDPRFEKLANEIIPLASK
jgi:serine/threonine protein kinase/tetratricopeptide (TPR) repeat protein